MAQQESQMEHLLGTSNLRINRIYKSNQLLIKLSRNGREWLSPIGWVTDEKGTLLDCRTEGKTTIVEIPKEFAKKLSSGDVIELTNPETDFKANVIWGKAAKAKANGAVPALAASAAIATGLSMADSEKRAIDAEKAAAAYRTKMEAASKAHEKAQAAALEAARKADEALKAEAARIAEMEQAAREFEEAEKFRLSEQRRLETERRLAEERRIEEVRLAEEARVKAEAQRLKTERSETRKFFKTEIENTKSDKARLKAILSTHKATAEKAEADMLANDKHLSKLQTSLSSVQNDEAETLAHFSKEQAKLADLSARKDHITTAKQELEKGNEKLFKRLEKADMAYQKAQKDVEAAKLRAVECLTALDEVKTESKMALDKKDTFDTESELIQGKLSAQSAKIESLKETKEKTRLRLEAEKAELQALRKNSETLTQSLTGTKTNISKTVTEIQEIDALLEKQKTSLRQLEDMEDADQIRILRGSAASKPLAAKLPKSDLGLAASKAKIPTKTSAQSDDSGFFSRLFKRGEKADIAKPAIAKPVVKAETKTIKPKPATKAAPKVVPKAAMTTSAPEIKAPLGKKTAKIGQESGFRLNSLLMLGVALTGLAVIGTATAVAKKSPDLKTTRLNTPADKPVQLASAANAISLDTAAQADVPKTGNDSEKPGAETAANIEAPKTDMPDLVSKTDKAPIIKTAALTPKIDKVSPKNPVKTALTSEIVAPKAAAPKRVVPKPRPVAQIDYTKLTKQAQDNLRLMGLYWGETNGLQTVETQTAIREFKTLYGLPVNNDISTAFLTALETAAKDQQVVEAPAQPVIVASLNQAEFSPAANEGIVKLADNSSDISYYTPPNPVAAAQAQPLGTLNVAPASAEPVQMAAITQMPQTITAPVQEDVIVPARKLKNASVEYPKRALRDRTADSAKVMVSYDIAADGTVENAKVVSLEYLGAERYKALFEQAAIKAVESQRFAPKTINGQASIEQGKTTKISFKTN